MKEQTYINILKALSDQNRLQIVCMLTKGEMCACKILEEFSITQPTLSHHMRVLCDVGLVSCRKDGKWQHYSIKSGADKEFIHFTEKLFEGKI